MEKAAARSRIRLTLSPQAEKYARRDAPVGVRRMAARGALPLEPIELATVLFALAHDPDAEVKDTARRSLDALPEHVLSVVVSGPAHCSMVLVVSGPALWQCSMVLRHLHSCSMRLEVEREVVSGPLGRHCSMLRHLHSSLHTL